MAIVLVLICVFVGLNYFDVPWVTALYARYVVAALETALLWLFAAAWLTKAISGMKDENMLEKAAEEYRELAKAEAAKLEPIA